MKKLIVILGAIIICATMAGCSGIESKTTVTSHTCWSMSDESGRIDSEYVVIDGEYIEVSSRSYK